MNPSQPQRQTPVLSAIRVAAPLLFFCVPNAAASPPVILFQPVEQRAVAGGRTELGVTAQCAPGDDCTLSYQWLHDGQPLSGAVNRLLFFHPVRAENAGAWQVVVRGTAGETWSRAVRLHVTEDPPATGTLDPAFSAAKIENPSGSVRGTVYAISSAADGGVLIGGDFTLVDGQARPGLAKLTAGGALDTTFSLSGIPALPGVRCLAAVPGGWLAGGSGFTVRKPWLAFIPENGGAVTNLESGFTFGAVSGQEIRALLPLPDGRIMAGGTFSVTAAGYSAARLIRLKADRRLDTTLPGAGWNAGVLALALTPDGHIVAGGNFSLPKRCLARLMPDGTHDAAFLPPAAGWSAAAEISALAVQSSGRIIAGGKFSLQVTDSFTRWSLAGFLAEGSLDVNFAAQLNTDGKAEVRALLNDGPDKVIVAGRFTEIIDEDAAGGTFKVPWTGTAWLDNQGHPARSQLPAAWDDRTVFSLAMQSPRRLLAGGDFAWPAARLTALRAYPPPPAAPVIQTGIVHPSVLRAGDPLRLSIAVTAWPRAEYQWLNNGQPLAGATTAELHLPNAQPAHSGRYTVRISNAAGSALSAPVDVTVHAAPPGYAPLVSASSTAPFVVGEFTTNFTALRVTVPFATTRIAVAMKVRHKDTNDLSATLIAPGGYRARLFKEPDPSGRNFDDTVFDDSSTLLLTDSLPPFRGTFQTGGTLNLLRGLAASGDWFLEIENNGGQTATLESWQLMIEGAAAPVTYATWRDSVLSGAAMTAPDEDADGDGESNAREYFFGPASCDPLTVPGGIHRITAAPGGVRSLHWCGWQSAAYQLECSADLLRWQPAVEGVDCTTTWTSRTEPARSEHTVRLGEAPVNRFWRLRGQ